jgi:hypothetical protein
MKKLGKKDKDEKDGASFRDTLEWIRDNGCILAKDCPYDFNGDVTSIEYERKVCIFMKMEEHLIDYNIE